jgi:hypothetical protein
MHKERLDKALSVRRRESNVFCGQLLELKLEHSRYDRLYKIALISMCVMLAAGCDPVITIAGANFPGWLLCAGAGAVLTALCRPVMVLGGIENYLRPLPLFYGALIVMFGLAAWLLFFAPA